jgi:tRNA-splicing endonuclease subunit Sen54
MPQYSLAKVVDARGTVFDTVGFTVRRQNDTHKRLELLPEEVLYLVERGSMLCWRESPNAPPREEDDIYDPVKPIGEPMSVQQCFAEMLGVEGINLERYQV